MKTVNLTDQEIEVIIESLSQTYDFVKQKLDAKGPLEDKERNNLAYYESHSKFLIKKLKEL